jgi:acetyl-CoA C-acetyltransferase
MTDRSGIFQAYEDIWILDGVRTPFVDYNGALALVSPTDLGIKVAREVFRRSGVTPADVGQVFAGSMAQADYDAYMLPRHIGLYSGVPLEVPATLTQRVCGTGFELLLQAADRIVLGQMACGLCVGTESMSRNPVAAYTHRGGFRMGQVEFKDFLWEATLDPSCGIRMGDTAENLARRHGLTRGEVDAFAARSFDRAVAAQASGWLAEEIVPVVEESFPCEGYRPRGIRLPRKVREVAVDSHIRPTSAEVRSSTAPPLRWWPPAAPRGPVPPDRSRAWRPGPSSAFPRR